GSGGPPGGARRPATRSSRSGSCSRTSTRSLRRMAVELRVPEVGESIKEVQIGAWLKGEGDRVERDEAVVEIESDKATLELPAPVSGTIEKLLKKKGDVVKSGELIATVTESAGGNGAKPKKAAAPAAKNATAAQPH